MWVWGRPLVLLLCAVHVNWGGRGACRLDWQHPCVLSSPDSAAALPLCSKTALSATASFEVRSPKLLQVSFQEGRVATPQLLEDLQLPSSLELLGQQVDLAPLQVGHRASGCGVGRGGMRGGVHWRRL